MNFVELDWSFLLLGLSFFNIECVYAAVYTLVPGVY